MNDSIVEYKAANGQDVKLSPQIIARYIVTGGQEASDRDVYSFMARCKALGLDPLAGDAYMTVYNTKNGPQSSVIVSKDYYLKTASSQPDFDGIEAGVVVIDRDGKIEHRTGALVGGSTEKLIGGWARVYSKERSHPSESVVSMSEYDQHRSLWKEKPATMIRKVALVNALREMWPVMFSQAYDESEIPQHPQIVEADSEDGTMQQVADQWPESFIKEVESF